MKAITLISILLISINLSNNLELAKSYKSLSNHNPIETQKYIGEPGAMVYESRLYIYGSHEGITEEVGTEPEINTHLETDSISIISTPDMVNWEDHGSIKIAGGEGVSKWAHNSWAPCACHKTIKGKEKFFVYFADSTNGIGVISSDSPLGPFTDPLGKALINRRTPGCQNVTWIVDPACFVDEDADEAYLVFGGGVPDGEEENPKNTRIVKLGSDMISIEGEPKVIDAPWCYGDNGLNKVGNFWVYSYLTNFSGGRYGNGRIVYLTADEPLGEYDTLRMCFNNPTDFFGVSVLNNHHSFIEFKEKWYLIYHLELLNKDIGGTEKGYRAVYIDSLPNDGSPFSRAKGTLAGVKQTDNVNAYETHNASMFAWQGGIKINGQGHTTVSFEEGDWIGVSQVDFGEKGAKKFSLSAYSVNGGKVDIILGKPDGEEVIGSVDLAEGGSEGEFEEVDGKIEGDGAIDIKDVFFVVSEGDVTIDTWEFF